MTAAVGYDRTVPRHGDEDLKANRVHVRGLGAYSRRGYMRTSGDVSVHDVGGAPIEINAFGQYYEYPQEDFFGFGIDSTEDTRSNYLLKAVEAGGTVHWRPSQFAFSAGAAFWRPETASGEDTRFPSVEEVFDPAQVAGLGTETDFLKLDATAGYDWLDNPAFPKAGGRYTVSATRYDDRDLGQFDSHRIAVSLQQFVPLLNRYRRVALRAEGVFTDADTGQSVPFYLQPTLGGARDLRGFREFRFRDRNAVLVGAEYQWEAWWALDVAFFAEAGTVAHKGRELTLNSMEGTYGVGFRFHSNGALVGRLDLAFSREGFIPLLRFDHVF
jgi:outer membrane protein assembly factor BamA